MRKYEELLNHLRFERAVKLQESGRKSKNFTAGAPAVQGDQLEYDPDPSIPSKDSPPLNPKTKYFATKKKEPGMLQMSKEEASGKELAALVLRSAQLQE